MKRLLFFILALIVTAMPLSANAAVVDAVNGRILLQVEASGEAWYVYPPERARYYLGRPADAFNAMRTLGLGVAHAELKGYLNSRFPSRLSGLIMLDVEENGEAYYVSPVDRRGYYLGRPTDAFQIMRERGLGISNIDLATISVSSSSAPVIEAAPVEEEPSTPSSEPEPEAAIPTLNDLEQRTHDLVNDYRETQGLSRLEWSPVVAGISLSHSTDMANGAPFSHDGFEERADAISSRIEIRAVGENLATNFGFSDPVQTAVDGWIQSPGHHANMVGDYTHSGVGVAQSSDGSFFITQMFIR